MSTPPAVSVVIPTHNRRDSVMRTLAALSRQTMSPDRFEVIVIADGCQDDTVTALRSQTYPFRHQVIEQAGQGQGKARNVGAETAGGALLVFLDDDIEPFPGMLSAYEAWHQRHPESLLLGLAFPALQDDRRLFFHGLRNWWHDHIRALTHPAHRFSYRDMHSGNFSMAAAVFARARGFDPEFFQRSGEDYEFGIRLLASGVPFVVVPDASSYHHDATDLARSLVRVRMEGRADVLIGIRHPELRASGALSAFRSHKSRWIRFLRDLAFRRPRLGDQVARALQSLLGPLELIRARRTWRSVYGAVRAYWYCRGAAEELATSATTATLEGFLDQVPPGNSQLEPVELDQGLIEVMNDLDRRRPRGITVRLSGFFLGTIPDIPGTEPLRGTHLAHFLDEAASSQALMALAARRLRSAAEARRSA